MVSLTKGVKQKLEYVLKNMDKIPESEYSNSNIIPLLNKANFDDYDWGADFVGVTRDGKIGYVFESGCSCYGCSWEPEKGAIPEKGNSEGETEWKHETTVKGFEMSIKDLDDYYNVFDLEEVDKNLTRLQNLIKA